MTPTETTDVQAAPSPAPQTETAPSFEVPRGEARQEWLRTGKLPEKPKAEQQPKEESAPSAKNTERSGSEPEHSREKPRSNAETRLTELLEDLRRAGLTPAELKTFKREAQQAAKSEPEKAPEPTVKPDDGAPKKPNSDDFKTWEEYEAARDKYYEDLADYKAQKRVEELVTRQRQEATTRELNERLDTAAKKYGAEAKPAILNAARELWTDAQIPQHVKDVLGGSQVLEDVLYVLSSKPEDFAAFVAEARSNPAAAIRRAVLVEKLVQDELSKGGKPAEEGAAPARNEKGQFQPAAPAKTETKAPPPPRETSGRGTAPPDPSEAAFNAGDFRAFREAENRRSLARLNGK